MTKQQTQLFKLIFGGLWLSLLLLALIGWWRSAIALSDVPMLLHDWLHETGVLKAGLIYIAIYAVRPLVLFPATFLTVASGLIFGPWIGTLFTIVGENSSANLAFTVARWLGRDSVASHSTALIRNWDTKLEQNGFLAVLTMRLVMLPFDAVNFGCGLTAIRHRDYALGTFIGILPSLIGFVLLGGIVAPDVQNRTLVVVLSVIFMLAGFGLAHHLKRKSHGDSP